MRRILLVVAAFLVTAPCARAQGAASTLLPAQPREVCSKLTSTASAKEWLERAAARVLPPADSGKIYRYTVGETSVDWIESDRMYEPFIPVPAQSMRWVDLAHASEGQSATERPAAPGKYPQALFTSNAAYGGRDTVAALLPGGSALNELARRMNPWLVLLDWQADPGSARVVERCTYRDYPRVVLERNGERLYLTESDATPSKLERIEASSTWGQHRAEYLWTTWWGVKGGGLHPAASYRILDGVVYASRRVQRQLVDPIPPDSAPRLVPPAGPMAAPAPPPGAANANAPVDTVRVSDHTFLLVAPFYTETVTLQRDTVYLLDATTGEDRARQDSTWIAALFPGRHPVTVVVTDLAWPHVGGVRFWVARGATIVSHRLSQDFLTRLVDRSWTLKPDLLERSRATSRLRFRPVTDSLKLGGGAVVVHALRGATTEGALAVYLPAEKYLWAGDYIQGDPTSPYVRDVVATVRALGLKPDNVGAQHIRLTPWNRIDKP